LCYTCAVMYHAYSVAFVRGLQMVDLWATGVTLFMMLTGRVPFTAPTLPEIYEKIKVCCCAAACCGCFV
jgi:serine/threonine protein kinase